MNQEYNQNIGINQQSMYPVNPQKNNLIKILIITGSIIVGIVALFIIIFFVISNKSEKLVCNSKEGKITIMYDDKTITGYTATGMFYELDEQKLYAEKIGVEEYLKEFTIWFKENTSGTCTINGEEVLTDDIEEPHMDAKVDWNALDININGDNYIYPYTLSKFLENGWQVKSEYQDKINQTVSKASEYEMSEEQKKWYTEQGYDVSEFQTTASINIELYKGDSTIDIIVDNTQSEMLVKDANITYLSTNNVNFKFYGVENSFTVKKVKDLFGTKNYESIEIDESVNTSNHYYVVYYASNNSVKFMLDDKTKLVKNIEIAVN